MPINVVQYVVIPTVHQESVVGQEVGTDEEMGDVGHHEPPCEILAQAQVRAERQPSIGGDGSAASRVEVVIYALPSLGD
jgi:hypothetical protein